MAIADLWGARIHAGLSGERKMITPVRRREGENENSFPAFTQSSRRICAAFTLAGV